MFISFYVLCYSSLPSRYHLLHSCSPGTLNHILSTHFVSFITSMTSHIYSLTKNSTPHASLSLGFYPSPIHAYSLTISRPHKIPFRLSLYSLNEAIHRIFEGRILLVLTTMNHFLEKDTTYTKDHVYLLMGYDIH